MKIFLFSNVSTVTCYNKILFFNWFLTDLPPSDEHSLEIQGSVTNCSVVMMEEQEDSMFNDQHFCK